MTFTVAIIVNIIALGRQKPALWMGFTALVPLTLLQLTGLYLFVQPYAAKWGSWRRPY
jgi:hypothetical protein